MELDQIRSILAMLFDIVQYLKGNNTNFKIMQSLIGVEYVSKGFIVRDWHGTTNTKRFSKFNKIFVKYCINFYYRYWILRNELYHKPEKQLEVVIYWSQMTKDYAMKVGGEARKFIEMNKIRDDYRNIN